MLRRHLTFTRLVHVRRLSIQQSEVQPTPSFYFSAVNRRKETQWATGGTRKRPSTDAPSDFLSQGSFKDRHGGGLRLPLLP